MQLFTNHSEEGRDSGFGWIDAEVIRFKLKQEGAKLKVPHMGWNTVNVMKSSKLFPITHKEYRFYFLHSYYVSCFNKIDVLTETNYGQNFASAFEKDNIVGVQFHPEKSHKFGMELFRNFMEYY
jgi:glutamine amidotransferase